jgi:excisionase family DNA binding protein
VTVLANETVWLTSGQAAGILGVSRSTMVRMLDAGRLPFDVPGTHRRVRLDDVLAYKASRHRGVLDALAESRREDEDRGARPANSEAVDDAIRSAREALARETQ